MKFKHVRVINADSGVYLNAKDILKVLQAVNTAYPTNTLATVLTILRKFHFEYLRARYNDAKNA
ncbi:MAG: hypothetical protein ACXADH_11115 [Candidatus Kariarchaeaceae archaeon]|jgi:hypothetical protein